MRRLLLLLCLSILSLALAPPGWAWPPTLEQFTALAKEAAPPGWRLSESMALARMADCAPQLVAVFTKNAKYLEYRLDLDTRQADDREVAGLRRELDGRHTLFLQAGGWQRFTYLTVYFPEHMASLSLGLDDELSYDEMVVLLSAFPLDKLLAPAPEGK